MEAIDAASAESRYVWAWIDEDAGILRSRYFASAVEYIERMLEKQLIAAIGKELPVEPELERWFPVWEVPI